MSTPYPQQPVGQPARLLRAGRPSIRACPRVFDCAWNLRQAMHPASRACDSEGELGIDHLGCCRVDSHRPDGAGHVDGPAS